MNIPTIAETNFTFPGQTGFYRGKVRDVYEIAGKYLVMVASDRISAFDHVLPRQIPCKGQVLNQIAARFLKICEDIVPNWILDVPDPNVTVGIRCEPIRIEMVIRGYLSGHAWRVYKEGGRTICGVKMPEGLCENDRFPEPIITPSTKASDGHDEDISEAGILKKGIVSPEVYKDLKKYTIALFARGTEYAAKMGLILVDTKYEFGMHDGKIVLMDEIHTPDSSRYFYAHSYEKLQRKGEKQRQLSKEFIREWLMEKEFQGLDGQQMPKMNDNIVDLVSSRYLELYRHLVGASLEIPQGNDIYVRMERNINASLKRLENRGI